ncbi:CoA-transferase [Clostridium sp. KNHs216]|uniref:CoA transferase subunit A n=1 Tax=Clostridium sp. KNHs216 TaxID=1550235 RepID=UPI00114DE039|nr:CoA-transferase [Clostridium sp. KNHs216]TQI66906.1 glutaconate CoA-transferase subunit A [Clostridium sp. KNHs216]
MELKEKLISMKEAASLVSDGDRLAIGGCAIHAHPMAFLRELVRQKKKDLTVVGSLNGLDVDLLAGAGMLKKVETSYVGLERYGLAKNFRRGVEQGEFQMVDYSDYLAFNRFHASLEKLSFWPCSYLGGSDILAKNPDIKEFNCPLTGKKYYAVPPADPDVAIIHAAAADVYGNVLMPQKRLVPQGVDVLMARSCDKVIVTVERIVSNDLIRRHNDLCFIPKYRVTAVVHAPYGAHPCSMPQFYNVDEGHFQEYVDASSDKENFSKYLDTYVTGVEDQEEYLEKVGVKKLLSLDLPTFI